MLTGTDLTSGDSPATTTKLVLQKFNTIEALIEAKKPQSTEQNSEAIELEIERLTNQNVISTGRNSIIYKYSWKDNIYTIKSFNLTHQKEVFNKYAIAEAHHMQEFDEHQLPVPKFYGFAQTNTHLYTAMEYCRAGSLFSYLAEHNAIDYAESYTLMSKATAALSFFHKYSIVHSDIKPENFLFNDKKELLLCDFSNVENVNVSDNDLKPLGTAGYTAPEVILREKPTLKSDIYSLGITYYEIVYRSPAYDINLSNEQVLEHTVQKKLPKMYKAFPKKIFNIITWCTLFNPEERPTCEELMQEFATDIETISSSLSSLKI